MVRVKICGLKDPDLVAFAAREGADWIGFMFPVSPRQVTLAAAETLLLSVGKAVPVAVLLDAPDDEVRTVMALGFPVLQLHGAETPARAAEVRRLTRAGIIKALPVREAADLDAARDWAEVADHLMFDAKPPEGATLPGGVGHAFDWEILAGRAFARPWFLAGGLDPDNVAQAISVTGAPLVDTSSGVESAPGVKEPARIAAFLSAVAKA
jgi:phosphoribosylanthranilate isomerase